MRASTTARAAYETLNGDADRIAGLRAIRLSDRFRVVGVYDGDAAGLDTDDGTQPWSTVCELHTHVVSHRTLRDAMGHAGYPTGWCEECMVDGLEVWPHLNGALRRVGWQLHRRGEWCNTYPTLADVTSAVHDLWESEQ